MAVLRMMVVAFISAVSTSLAIAENPVSIANVAKVERTVRQELYGGVVANQTMTVAGQDFYRHFVSAWNEQDLSARFAISVHERPSARWGTQVWVEYAQRRIFQASLPTGRAGIRALSERAAEIALQKVADVEVERLLFRDADLGADEI